MAQRNQDYHGPVSDHFDGTRFFNPGQQSTDKTLSDMLRWQFQGKRAVWDLGPPDARATKPAERVSGLTITAIGHASLLIQLAGLNLLLDPVWSDRASPVRFAGPRRANPPGIAFGDLPPIDAVLISHSHYDHLDTDTLARLLVTHRPRVIAPLGTDAVIARAVPGCRVETADWGDRFTLSPAVTVTLHPAYHWSARGVRDRRMTLWCGFVMATPEGPIYLAGDTAYGDGEIFRAVREVYGPPLVAVLPIGAYEPRWFMRSQHVNPEEAVRIMRDTGASQALGVHWGTFQLTDEPRLAPVEALAEACAQHGVAPECFIPLRPGDIWTPVS